MRCETTLKVGILLAAMSAPAWAQNVETDPLSVKIRAQEAVVAAPQNMADGAAWLELAVLYQDKARYQEAEHAYRKAIGLLKSGNRGVLADGFDHMGTMYAEIGRFSKAESMERKALDIREAEGDLVAIGVSNMHLSVLSLGKHDLPSAEVEAETAVSILLSGKKGSSPGSVATPEEKMTALIDLSLIRCARGACADALPDLTRALSLAHASYSANSLPVGFLDFLMGYAHWKSGDNRTAAEQMKRGTSELASQLGWGHPTYLAALKQYDAFLIRNGDPAEAADLEAKVSEMERSRPSARSEPERASIGLNLLP